MARQLRLEFQGAIYHVTCRMLGDWHTEHNLLFRDNSDRQRFLERLSERVEQYQIRLFLFVCMTNHVHLVFETPEANCSKFMQAVLTAYTVYYNLRHSRHGHLFDGRYKAKLVKGDNYLLALSRYVHLNPMQVGAMKEMPLSERIKALRAYSWSSYPSYIGDKERLQFIEYAPLLSEMPGAKRDWPQRYRKFVESGLAESDEDFKTAMKLSPRCIGGDDFRAWVDKLYRKQTENYGRIEDVSFRRISEPLSSAEVLSLLGEMFGLEEHEFNCRRHGSALRGIASSLLIRFCGLSQREVADLLGAGTGAAVCNQLSRLPAKLAADRDLWRLAMLAQARLEQMKRDKLDQTITSRK